MTDIDHATEARAQLIDAEAYVGANMLAQTGESKTDVLLAAQVHATLALVEQWRIANEHTQRVADQNDAILGRFQELSRVAREGWEKHNRLVALLEGQEAGE